MFLVVEKMPGYYDFLVIQRFTLILIFVARHPFPQNGYILPQVSFSQFSPKILLFSKNLFYNKTSAT